MIIVTYVSSSNDFIFAVPDQAVEWQQTGRDVEHRAGRLLRSARVDNSDTAIVSGESKGVTAGGERDTVDPASGIVEEFSTNGIERETLTPGAGLRALIDTLDEAGENTSVRVGGSGSQKNRVRVPGKSGDGTADRLLQMLRDPPVVFLFEVADRDHAGSGADGEFLLRGRPTHKGCGTVDSEKNERGLPARSGLFPDVGVTV